MAVVESLMLASFRVHLEVHVRPAAGIAGREDRGEGDLSVGVGDLHAAEEVLVLDALGVHRVATLASAVPQVQRRSLERHPAVGEVGNRQFDRGRDPLGHATRVAEARRDVAAHDAALLEDVGTVGAVAGVGARRFLGDLGEIRPSDRRLR